MLSNDDVKNMILEIERALENLKINLHTIELEKVLDKMGFPYNWKEIANIEKR